MISKDLYKERPAVKRSNGKTEFLFLPKDGAKLVSFRTKKLQILLQARKSPYEMWHYISGK